MTALAYFCPRLTFLWLTIVLALSLQSDVAHTMQHWHVYRKWNARLFREMYRAYVDGRADTDPCESWYKVRTESFVSFGGGILSSPRLI